MEHGARVVRRHECQGGPRHACTARRLARSRARRAWRRRTAPREVRRLRRARGAWGPNPCAAQRRGVPFFFLLSLFRLLGRCMVFGFRRSASARGRFRSCGRRSPLRRPLCRVRVFLAPSCVWAPRRARFGRGPSVSRPCFSVASPASPRRLALVCPVRRPRLSLLVALPPPPSRSLAWRSCCLWLCVLAVSSSVVRALARRLFLGPSLPALGPPSARFPRPGLAPVRSRSLWGPLAVSLGVAAVARAAAAVAVASGRLPSCSAPPPPPGPRPPLFVRGRFRSLSRSASPPSLGPPPPLSGRRFRSLAVRLGVVAVARAAVAVCRRFLFLRASARRAPPVRGTSRAAAACAPVRRRARGAPAVLPRVRPCCTAYVKRPRDHDVCACAAPSRSDAPAPRVRLCSTA